MRGEDCQKLALVGNRNELPEPRVEGDQPSSLLDRQQQQMSVGHLSVAGETLEREILALRQGGAVLPEHVPR